MELNGNKCVMVIDEALPLGIITNKAQEYLDSADVPIMNVDRLEAELEAKMRALYHNGMESAGRRRLE